jgi:hypothetical protein
MNRLAILIAIISIRGFIIEGANLPRGSRTAS